MCKRHKLDLSIKRTWRMYKACCLKTIVIFLSLILTLNIDAQNNDSIQIHPDMNLIKYTSAWLRSDNVAGLYILPVKNISLAEAYFKKDNGKFINYHESDNSFNYGFKAESFYRLGADVVVSGDIGYSGFRGQNMAGSTLINPYFNAFDITEVNDSTAGRKKSEEYHLVGAISAKVLPGLYLGGKIDYVAKNYVKHRDLRHRNELTDATFSIGAVYNLTKKIKIGANYLYRRSIEELNFNRYGTIDVNHYYMLIDYGSFYGYRQSFTGSASSRIDSDTKPIANIFNGAEVQLEWKINDNLNLFNEFLYNSRKGHFGVKTSGFKGYSDNSSTILGYNGELILNKKRNTHVVGVNLQHESLENYENSYRDQTSPGGVTTTEYVGQNLVLNKTEYQAKIHYKGFIGINSFLPQWVLRADINYYNRDRKTSQYPYYRKQDLHFVNFQLGGEKNIVKNKNIYTISIDAGYHFGGGNAKSDGLYVIPTESQKLPWSIDEYLNQEFEYLTASTLSVDASFKYSRQINQSLWGYIAVSGRVKNGFDIEYVQGKTHISTLIKIGCSF